MLASYVIFEIQHVFSARPARRHAARLSSFTSFPYLATSLPPYFLFSNSFPCHTSENSPVSPSIATLPKTPVSNPCVCHTCETPRGWGSLLTLAPNSQPSTFNFQLSTFSIQFFLDTPTQRPLTNPFAINSLRALFIAMGGVPPPSIFFSPPPAARAPQFWLQRRERLCHEPRER